MAFLPPGQKKLVYADQPATVAPVTDEAVATPVPSAETRSASEPDGAAVLSRPMTVLLLGAQQDHEANLTKLGDKGFTLLRVVKPEELDLFLTDDTCGIIVSGSWWAALPPG